MHPWLGRLRHDLLKHALWWASDLAALDGQPPAAADVRALRRSLLELMDSEGRPATALALWRELRADSPAAPAALDDFERAVAAAQTAVAELEGGDEHLGRALAAVHQLEQAFARLARHLSP
jgi:hypothetical protein